MMRDGRRPGAVLRLADRDVPVFSGWGGPGMTLSRDRPAREHNRGDTGLRRPQGGAGPRRLGSALTCLMLNGQPGGYARLCLPGQQMTLPG